MYFAIVVECAQLNAGYHTDSRLLGRLASGANPIDRVVIRQRYRGQPALLGGLDHLFGRESAVRGGRVGMQVDERRPTRLCAHRA
jgi:hypothetical protein